MNEVLLARWQFGLTTVYHFFFVPLTLGLSLLLAAMETRYVRTGDAVYKRMTKFWGKLFLINFGMGVATGIVQEFQFGMNWSEYSRYVGDIFGAPLAIEALLTFFLESVFLGVWVFGWSRLSKKLHLLAIWLVAIGSNLSALWILIANSWMQQPVGYVLNPETGRAELDNFLNVITNSHIPFQFGHVFFAGWCTAAFFVLGISAWQLARGREEDRPVFRRSFRMAAIYGLAGSLLVVGLGHAQGQHVARHQPMKMAAAEALWDTENPAGLSLFSVIDEKHQKNSIQLRVPAVLSFMIYNRFSGEVKGIKDLQAEMEAKHGSGNYIPPVTVIFWSFRLMVGAGGLLILLALYALWLSRRAEFALPRWAATAALVGLFLPYLANSTGWLMTEMGRQPWLVYGLLTAAEGVSKAASAPEIWFTLAGFTLLYGVLMAADVVLLRQYARAGANDDADELPN